MIYWHFIAQWYIYTVHGQSFSLMESWTGGCNIIVDHFREILHNLKGYEVSTRPNVRSVNQWDDQRNLLHNLHPLKGKMFERSMHFFLIESMDATFMMMS